VNRTYLGLPGFITFRQLGQNTWAALLNAETWQAPDHRRELNQSLSHRRLSSGYCWPMIKPPYAKLGQVGISPIPRPCFSAPP